MEQAHHYIFNILYDPEIPDDPETGGAFIKIEIQDENLIDPGIVLIASRPTITGVDFDIRNQVVCLEDEDIPENISLQICGFDGLDDVEFTPKCCSWATLLGDAANGKLTGNKTVNFTKASPTIINLCKDNGIEFSEPEMNADKTVATAFLTISKDVIRRLPKQGKEHKFLIKVVDDGGRETIDSLCIARSEAAIRVADPIEVYTIDDNDCMAVLAHSATIPFKLSSTYDGTDIRGVEYTKKGENDWKFVAASEPSGILRRASAPAGSPTVTITGLESGTTYQYRARCGEFTGSQINEFTTESPFIIPNYSMEEWSNFSENSKILLPGAGGERTFWDSGNHGSATMDVTLTQGSTDMFHSGEKSAKLRSQFVGIGGFAGKFAAGNLFAGTYLETQGTDGRLEFGRPYNGSHPTALSVWVNYRPGVADKNGSKNGHLAQGDLDSGQIYVALSTEPVEIRTKSSNRKLFNKDDNCILAYGEYTFNQSNYGPDGALQELKINLDYNERAQTNKPLYLIIVCSASKFGDYFDGGEGSTMYLDDFELIYE
ncbi:MAG: PCMD domain-containing protein [Muribaculaceae bacterium]|nr:PCMD domain-containing protein [Muribaculaceae bacterium]